MNILPKEGYTSITVSDNLYSKIGEFIDRYNGKVGFRRFRSISQLVEEAVGIYLNQKSEPEKGKVG